MRRGRDYDFIILPTLCNDKIVKKIIIPGNSAVHQLPELCLKPASIFPHEIISPGKPIPINERVDSTTNKPEVKNTKLIMTGLMALGMACLIRI